MCLTSRRFIRKDRANYYNLFDINVKTLYTIYFYLINKNNYKSILLKLKFRVLARERLNEKDRVRKARFIERTELMLKININNLI